MIRNLAIAVGMLLIGGAGTMAAAETVRIGVPDIAPYGSVDDGFVFQVAVERRLSRADTANVEFVALPALALKEQLETGALDAVVATAAAGLDGVASAVATFGRARFGLASLKTDAPPVAFAHLQDRRVSFWGPTNQFAKFFPEGSVPLHVPARTYQQGMADMLTNRVDAVLGAEYSLWYTFQSYGIENARFESLQDRQIYLWRMAGWDVPMLDRLEERLKLQPVSAAEIDNLARTKVTSQKHDSLRITTPDLQSVNDEGDNIWMRDFINQIDLMNNRLSLIGVQPFDRSLRSVESGDFDVHVPLIEVETLHLGYPDLVYVGPPLFTVEFKAYVAHANVYDPATGRFADGARVGSDSTHAALFGPPFTGLACLECGLRMVAARRLDAFVFASAQMDPQLRDEGLEGRVTALPYRVFPVRAAARADIAQEADSWLTEGMEGLRSQGVYEEWIKSGSVSFGISAAP